MQMHDGRFLLKLVRADQSEQAWLLGMAAFKETGTKTCYQTEGEYFQSKSLLDVFIEK